MAVFSKPRTGSFKPIAGLSRKDLERIVRDCKNPPKASASLKERMATARLSIKTREHA